MNKISLLLKQLAVRSKISQQ